MDIFVTLLRRLLCEEVERRLVRMAVEVFLQGRFEEGIVAGCSQEQGHAGSEFEIVWISEDLFSAAPLYISNKLRTFSESLT